MSEDFYCPIYSVTKLIGGKWKMPVMWMIQAGPKRFGELRRALTPITEQMLTKQLRELENHNLIKRIMDMGSHGVIVPNVLNKNEAINVINAVKYPPLGN